MKMEFKPWPKIVRIENKRAPVFTEKLDGTNACIVIGEYGEFACQSRTRFITPNSDNYGFARWAYERKDELEKLGPGYHFGEWWGLGIQRGYGVAEKRFSLFNTRRWGGDCQNPPSCCHVVPILPVSSVDEAISFLKKNGSMAAPGWERPEGAVMYEPDTDTCFKIIIDK
jgi:RNA ligase